jgi:hypothetical protein
VPSACLARLALHEGSRKELATYFEKKKDGMARFVAPIPANHDADLNSAKIARRHAHAWSISSKPFRMLIAGIVLASIPSA